MERNEGTIKGFMRAIVEHSPPAGLAKEFIFKKFPGRQPEVGELYHFQLMLDARLMTESASSSESAPLYQLTWAGYDLYAKLR